MTNESLEVWKWKGELTFPWIDISSSVGPERLFTFKMLFSEKNVVFDKERAPPQMITQPSEGSEPLCFSLVRQSYRYFLQGGCTPESKSEAGRGQREGMGLAQVFQVHQHAMGRSTMRACSFCLERERPRISSSEESKQHCSVEITKLAQGMDVVKPYVWGPTCIWLPTSAKIEDHSV